MKEVQFIKNGIINDGETNHLEELLPLFEDSTEVHIAVAFLKVSGFERIKESLRFFGKNRNSKIIFYIGLGFGVTDPKALNKLYNLIKTNTKNKLILCTPKAGIFHSKVYLFRNDETAQIITGSSNLTHHGLIVNDELSVRFETDVNSDSYLQLKDYFKDLHKKYYTKNVKRLIDKYEQSLSEYNNNHEIPSPFNFKRRKSSIKEIDFPRLEGYYEIYKDSEEFIIPTQREKQYILAKKYLNVLASNKKLTKLQFHKLFGALVGHKEYKPKLWHSGSIHRKTYKTLEYTEEFRELVRFIKKQINKPAEKAFELSLNYLNKLRKEKRMSGVGVNIIAEILMSFNYNKFANLNDNPWDVLYCLGKEFPAPSSFKAEDYKEFIDLLDKIRIALDLKTYLEIDSFFNYAYWNLLEKD